MKILKLNGLKYSRGSFEGYKFRAKVIITTIKSDSMPCEFHLDIYTTDADRASLENVLLDRKSDDVTSLNIVYWTTKEQDDRAAELINETLSAI